jgi:hypothetical protein
MGESQIELRTKLGSAPVRVKGHGIDQALI